MYCIIAEDQPCKLNNNIESIFRALLHLFKNEKIAYIFI